MKVKRLTDADIPKVCRTVAKILADSQEASHMLKDITDKQSLARAFMSAQIKYWHNTGEVWTIGNNQGILSGHYSAKEGARIFKSLGAMFGGIFGVFRVLSKEDRKKLLRNLSASSGAQNMKWRKQVCKRSDYYYIDLIAIDPALKGSGAFRKLVEPVLVRAKDERMPVLLDTHDRNNVPIYQRFGFDLVRRYTAKNDRDFIQYAMIKRP